MASKRVQKHSLRDRQIASLRRMLTLNDDTDVDVEEEKDGLSATTEIVWKVLVFDDIGRDILASIMRVHDLRAQGVTMHMHIGTSRHPIPDVPVIYFLEATPKNMELITRDLQTGLYETAYINCLGSIQRPILEQFAADTAAAGTSERIAQLFDQYSNFVLTEPDLFSLGMGERRSYRTFNSAKTKDEELDQVVDKIVSGLFSVVVTMGTIPIIRCPQGEAAELIANKLDRKLRDFFVNNKNNVFNKARPSSPTGSSSRPVLIIVDRNIDLIPVLNHSWTYRSLIHDVLDIKLNRITIETPKDENDASKGTKRESYNLAPDDFFWERNAGAAFPQVAEDIDAELTAYKEETAEITRKTGTASLEDLQNEMGASTQHLKAAIEQLPKLRERKAVLDMHMNILAALLNGIKARQLDHYLQLEENITKQTKAQILDLIKDSSHGGKPLDKLRLFFLWILSTEQDVTRAEWTQFEEALTAAGADTSSVAYIRQVRARTKMSQLTTVNAPAPQSSVSSDLLGRFSSISNRFADRLKESGVSSNLSANFDGLIGGLKNFLPQNRDLTLTKVVESIMDPSAAASTAIAKTEHYLFLDPRSSYSRSSARSGGGPSAGGAPAPGAFPGSKGGADGGPGASASFGQKRQGFTEAIVFVVGGGSTDEYGNLQEWVARTGDDRARKRVIYGSTEMVSSEEFIKQELEVLGQEL